MTSTLFRASDTPVLNAPTLHRLANGLTIVAEQMPVDAVNLNLWLNVGSVLESDAINGMAHFLEHMVFKGTPRLQSGEFEQRVEERGAVTNAATSQDYTHYYLTAAPRDFAELAPLLVDVVMNPTIPADSFERERQVVLEEIRRSQDNPRRRTFQHATELSFEHLPYRRQVLGPATVIEQLQPEQMRDFHATWYQPQSLTAVAVGNLPVARLIQIVEDSFAQAGASSLAAAQRPRSSTSLLELNLPSFLPETPFQTIVRREVTDPSLQQARLVMLWRVPGLNELEQTYALDMLASVLGHGRTARLFQDLREQRGLVSSISASNTTYQHQGVFYISAHLPTENLAVVETAIADHLRQMQQEWITTAELDRIKARVASHFIFGNETPSDRSGLYGYYQTLVGDLTAATRYPEFIRHLKAEDLQRAADQYLSPEAYGVVVIKPAQD